MSRSTKDQTMFGRIKEAISRNKKLIVLTFEVFWIVVFLLNRIAGDAMEMPEFIYVNF